MSGPIPRGGEPVHRWHRYVSRWRLITLLTLAGAALFCGGWKWAELRYYRRTLARAEDEIDSGLYTLATQDLAELLARYPGSDELLFLLGTCEKARGRADSAAAAWAKIPWSSPYGFRALEARVRLDIEHGRLSAAEQRIIQARGNPELTGPDPDILLGPLYCLEGRFGEAMQLLETLWNRQEKAGNAASETAVKHLRLYIQLQVAPTPDETIRTTLDRAGQVSPDDDRIWLWKAKLAIRTHAYEEAGRWIDRCLKQRPDDPLVWQSRLDWAIATHQAALAQEAMEHLPAATLSLLQNETLAAWFAVERGDTAAEQTALERLIARDPTDLAATDRLIAILIKNGRKDLAARYRRRKDAIAQLQSRYRLLFTRNQPRRDGAEMARLAKELGRSFEARAFQTLAQALAPGRRAVSVTSSGGSSDPLAVPIQD
jgi:enediyne biosynthesis protein E4